MQNDQQSDASLDHAIAIAREWAFGDDGQAGGQVTLHVHRRPGRSDPRIEVQMHGQAVGAIPTHAARHDFVPDDGRAPFSTWEWFEHGVRLVAYTPMPISSASAKVSP